MVFEIIGSKHFSAKHIFVNWMLEIFRLNV